VPKSTTPLLTVRFIRAVEFATAAHASQLRKGTTIPYIAHPLAVSALVIEHQGDEDEAIAALLHDVPEDQGGLPMLEEIRARFGSRVANIVEGCTDTFESPKPPWRERKDAYIAHLASADRSTCLVSAADKLHNARAIRQDMLTHGDEVWQRFNAAPSELAWYYGALGTALRARLSGCPGLPLVDALERTVRAIWPEREAH
jgi:(p)ppGpp synthase/HD superfamily hydrolase